MPTSSPWLAPFGARPAANFRLFCFPYAGGGAAAYRQWVDALPPAVELLPVKLPGRENRLRERPFTWLPALIEEVARALRPYFDLPFAFWGHSMGALIGFELARYLRRINEAEPVHLFVSGYPAPQLPASGPFIHQLPQADFIDELRRLRGTPEAVLQHAELMALLLPTLRADFTLLETYVYVAEAPLDCSISAFGGLEDGRASPNQLLAWREQTQRNFQLHLFPGDHFFLNENRAQLLAVLARELTQLLAAFGKR